jgi:hypothetical protein
MKSLMTALILLIGSAAMAQSRAVTHVDSEKVAAALAGGRGGGSLLATKDFTVSGIKRTGPGQVEIHDRETDIFYITDGEATFVTGGTMVGGKQTAPGQTRGTDLHGGQTVRLKRRRDHDSGGRRALVQGRVAVDQLSDRQGHQVILLVTGAGRGIGAATARMAAARGYDVCVNYRANHDAASRVVKDVQAAGRHAIAVAADVSVDADVVRLFDTCDRELGRVDALVNNAAILDTQMRLDAMDAAHHARAGDERRRSVSLRQRSRQADVDEVRRPRGAIVNVSSGARAWDRLGISTTPRRGARHDDRGSRGWRLKASA